MEGQMNFEMSRDSTEEVAKYNKSMFVTPKKSSDSSMTCNEIYPYCEEELRPQQGMTFDSLEEGVKFYKQYAHHVGFSVRLSLETKKDDGFIYWKYLVCSKEGWHKEKGIELVELQMPINDDEKKLKRKRRRSLTREGCLAMCSFKRTLEGKYHIFKAHEGHTHALATPSKKSMLRSARKVNPLLKSMLRACHRTNIGTSSTFNVVKEQVGGINNVGCTRRDLQNYHRDLKALIQDSDAHMFIENFKRMKQKNASFYFAYELDDQNRLKHVFWADGIARKNYALFGDAVSFDTTYSTNKYSLIFAPFTGVNHHRQSVTFGAAFLANEQVESFVWLFERFLEAMGGHGPKCIITDQDHAMKNAMERVFNTSTHRFCIWHIMRKVSEKVGGALNSDADFYRRLKACVWQSETPEEFELAWLSVVSDFGLQKNDWFTLMYDLREMWIPAYFRGVFLAGLFRTTSRSESQNVVFSRFSNKQLSLVEFWMRFECVVEIQRDNERELDNANASSVPQMKTSIDLEKHGREIYTHKNFYIFQDELWASCVHCVVTKIHEEDEGSRVLTVQDSAKEALRPTRNVLYFVSTQEAKCTCKMYELQGIPCRHILLVLRGDMLKKIPTSLIANRWTKTATTYSIFDDYGILLTGSEKDTKKDQLISKVWEAIFEIMHVANKSEDDIKIVMEGCSSIKNLLSSKGEKKLSKVQELQSFANCGERPEQADIRLPNPSNTKGRSKRIKSGKELAMEQKLKKPRLCKACGKYGTHNSRTCPTNEKDV